MLARSHHYLGLAVALAAGLAALTPRLERAAATHDVSRRLDRAQLAAYALLPDALAPEARAAPALSHRIERLGPLLASWQTVGGCGAGASSGTGSGIKWIGRGVRGGLFYLETQVNYVRMPYGYNFISTTLLSYDLTPEWSLGVSVPYLYKFMNDPFKVRVDLANKGPGDVAVLATRHLGDARAWKLTLSLGIPVGTNDVAYLMQRLPQDRQLGLGKPTASLVLDHTIDNLWGPIVLGGTANWRGGTNNLGSYRGPSASVYSYAGVLLGPFVPAAGLSVTGFAASDRDFGEPQALPYASAAANVSLEWSTDWMALLLAGSLPYDVGVHSTTVPAFNRFGPWTVALGAAFAVF